MPQPAGRHLILIVEDDDQVAAALKAQLEAEGYRCQRAANGPEAIGLTQRQPPDLILLDRGLPGLSGDEVVRRLRNDSRTAGVPTIMLTGRAEEVDELVGLGLGADDYMAKPYSIRRLLARIAVQLRRRAELDTAAADGAASTVTLDRAQSRAFVDAQPVALTATEYKLLGALLAARGHLLGSDRLARLVYGPQVPSEEQLIEREIESLRRKLGPAAGHIHAVPEHGYTYSGPTGPASWR